MRSIAGRHHAQPECRTAAIPATSSHMRMITPPCTSPAVFESAMPIQRVRPSADCGGGRGSTRRWIV